MARDPNQPDLFDAPPAAHSGRSAPPASIELSTPPCQVFSFPLDRRRRKIITVARTLEARKTEEGRSNLWLRVIDDLSAELRRHGAGQAEVDRQLQSFRAAVADELSRGVSEPQNPHGAA